MGQKSILQNMIFGINHGFFPSSQAACIFYSCRFLSLDLGASPQLIDEIMNAPFRRKVDADVHTLALDFNHLFVPYRKVPYMIDKRDIDYFAPKDLLDNECINVEEDREAYKHLFHFMQEMPQIHAAIIIGNNLAIGMRKRKRQLEFFDPTGDDTITKNNGHAYIQIAEDPILAASYLNKRFPSSPEGGDLSPLLNVWNFCYISKPI